MLGEGAHVLSVHQHPALGDIVEPGDELAQGGLAAAGGAHHRHSLAGPDVEGDVLQHRRIGGLIPEGHVLHPDVHICSVSSLGVSSSWMSGSTRIRATNRLKPAMPCINCSTKAESLRMGVMKVEM